MLLSVIIPMYNEENNVIGTAQALLDCLRKADIDFEIILSDDGSTDATAEKAASIAANNPEIRLIRYETNHGKGYSVRLGMLESLGEYAIFTDCDLAYGTDVILDVLSELRASDADICIGSRAIHPSGYSDYPWMRRLFSETYIKILKRHAGFVYSDSQCGIKGFSRAAANAIFSKCVIDGFAFDLEALILADKLGFKIKEHPVRVLSHVSKASKVHMFRDAFKMLRDVKVIKRTHAQR